MSSLFSYDNKYVSSVNKAVDAFVLGLLWLVCSIPVLTIGAASAALYYAFHKSVRQGNGHPTREFFRSFKSNFKQATLLWLMLLFLVPVLVLDLFVLTGSVLPIGTLQPFLVVTSLLILAISVVWGLIVFPYISRFACNTVTALKNSFVITLVNFHWGLLLLILLAVAVALFFTIPLVSLFVPAAYAFLANRILERVFRKYMRAEDLAAQKEADFQN